MTTKPIVIVSHDPVVCNTTFVCTSSQEDVSCIVREEIRARVCSGSTSEKLQRAEPLVTKVVSFPDLAKSHECGAWTRFSSPSCTRNPRCVMEKGATTVTKPDVIDQYGRIGAADPLLVQQPANDGSLLGQISSNPFFTAVSRRGRPDTYEHLLKKLIGTRSCWVWRSPRCCPEGRSS